MNDRDAKIYVETIPRTIRNRNGNDLYVGDKSGGMKYRFGSSGCTTGTILDAATVLPIAASDDADDDDCGAKSEDVDVAINLLLGTI